MRVGANPETRLFRRCASTTSPPSSSTRAPGAKPRCSSKPSRAIRVASALSLAACAARAAGCRARPAAAAAVAARLDRTRRARHADLGGADRHTLAHHGGRADRGHVRQRTRAAADEPERCASGGVRGVHRVSRAARGRERHRMDAAPLRARSARRSRLCAHARRGIVGRSDRRERNLRLCGRSRTDRWARRQQPAARERRRADRARSRRETRAGGARGLRRLMRAIVRDLAGGNLNAWTLSARRYLDIADAADRAGERCASAPRPR